MLDNKVTSMSPGEALLDVPIGDLIQKLGVSIAEAQLRLDQMAVRVAALLSEAKVDFQKSDGTKTTKSLLELGFTPTFYHFTETDIEVKLTIAMKVEEAFDAGGKASAGSEAPGSGQGTGEKKGDNRLVPWGATVNAEYHRKYEFDMSGSSSIKTRLVAIPAPTVFLDTIKEHARSGGSIAANG